MSGALSRRSYIPAKAPVIADANVNKKESGKTFSGPNELSK